MDYENATREQLIAEIERVKRYYTKLMDARVKYYQSLIPKNYATAIIPELPSGREETDA